MFQLTNYFKSLSLEIHAGVSVPASMLVGNRTEHVQSAGKVN